MAKVKLTESQLRTIIHEELLEHYLIQKDLWSEVCDKDHEKKPQPLNKDGQTA